MHTISDTNHKQLIKTLSTLIDSVDSVKVKADMKLANTVRNAKVLVKKLNKK